MTANINTFGRLGVAASSPATQFMEYLSFGVRKRTVHAHDEGIRGTRDRYINRSRIVQSIVSGPIAMQPSISEIDWWVSRILGGTTAGGVTLVAETLPSFYAIWDSGDNVHEFSGCKVDKATLSGSSGRPLDLSVDIEGLTEALNSASFPAITAATDSMFVASDVTLTLGGSAVEVESWQMVIDNMLLKDRFNNSLVRTELPESDRIVSLNCVVPYNTTNVGLYSDAVAGIEGVLAFTGNGSTYTWTFGQLLAPKEGPAGNGRGELKLNLNFRAFNDGTLSSVKVAKT
jgi:hypothetical protein